MNKFIITVLLAAACTNASAETRFDGLYGGLSFGYVKGEDSNRELDDGEFNGYTSNTEPSGAKYGLVGGYNWSLTEKYIVGIEVDYLFSGADDKSVFFDDDGLPDTDYPVAVKLINSFSIRMRTGLVFNDNKTMAFLTAGYAGAELERSYFFEESASGNTTLHSQKSMSRQDGWTAGVGIEHALTESLSLQAEYRYADYGTKSVNTTEVYGEGYTEKQRYDEQSLRLTINFCF